jgi:hypothetical protein
MGSGSFHRVLWVHRIGFSVVKLLLDSGKPKKTYRAHIIPKC